MKKFKYNIEKNNRLLKELAPTNFDYILIIVSLALSGLCVDLEKIFNISLETIGGVLSAVFLAELMLVLCWFIHMIVHKIIVNRALKITPLDKENNEHED